MRSKEPAPKNASASVPTPFNSAQPTVAIAPKPDASAIHPQPKRRSTAALQDASRFSEISGTPPGFGVRLCSAALGCFEVTDGSDATVPSPPKNFNLLTLVL